MSNLYKRFFIVALLIATMGVLTANLIQQTRTVPNSITSTPKPNFLKQDCRDARYCYRPTTATFLNLIG